MILVVDTSIVGAQMALVQNGQIIWSGAHLENSGSLAAITQLFAAAGVRASALEGVAVSFGPGSFTGIKVGLAFVYGLVAARAEGQALPVFGASALAAAAQEIGVQRRYQRLGLLLPATRTHGFLAVADNLPQQCLVNTAPRTEPHEPEASIARRLARLPADLPLFTVGAWPQMSEALHSLSKVSEQLALDEVCRLALKALSQQAWTAYPEQYSQSLPEPLYLRLSTAEEALLAASHKQQHSAASQARE